MECPDYSIAIPVFNEVECLEELVARVRKAMEPVSPKWELILVDDGSTDGSFEKIRALKEHCPNVRGLQFASNQGQTAAMAAGIRAARGKVIITLDADLQNDPADIPLLLDALTHADAAVGWRAKRHDPWIRRASSRIANWIRNLLSNETIQDTGCSLKAFRAEKLQGVPLFEGMHRFLPTLVKMAGGTVVEVIVSHHPRLKGVSKYNVLNRVFKSFLDLLAIRWMKWRQLTYRISHEI